METTRKMSSLPGNVPFLFTTSQTLFVAIATDVGAAAGVVVVFDVVVVPPAGVGVTGVTGVGVIGVVDGDGTVEAGRVAGLGVVVTGVTLPVIVLRAGGTCGCAGVTIGVTGPAAPVGPVKGLTAGVGVAVPGVSAESCWTKGSLLL